MYNNRNGVFCQQKCGCSDTCTIPPFVPALGIRKRLRRIIHRFIAADDFDKYSQEEKQRAMAVNTREQMICYTRYKVDRTHQKGQFILTGSAIFGNM